MYKHKRYKMCVRSFCLCFCLCFFTHVPKSSPILRDLHKIYNFLLFLRHKKTHKFTNVYKQNINTSQSSPKSRKCVTCVSHMFHICFTYGSHICFHLRCTYTSHTYHIRSTNVNVYVSFDFCIRGHLGYVCVPPRQLL